MLTSYDIADKNGLLSYGEIDLTKMHVRTLPPQAVVVIIGAGAGTSSIAMLEERLDITIFSVDSEFPTTNMYDPGEKQNLKRADLWKTGRVIQVLGTSQLYGQHWPVPYDMIFIDGDHRYDFVKRDIELWIPKAKENAVLIFHDYADKKIKPKAGVKQAVDELLLTTGEWEIVGHENVMVALKRKIL